VLLLRVMCVTCLLCTCCTTATGLKPICSKIINIYIKFLTAHKAGGMITVFPALSLESSQARYQRI
jgi:hypothetical protein